jgi:hypothetical protein
MKLNIKLSFIVLVILVTNTICVKHRLHAKHHKISVDSYENQDEIE